MLLAIDSGNTNIVFAIFDGDGQKRGEWRASTNANRTADEYSVWLSQLMKENGLSRKDIKSAIVATVVPTTLFSLKSLCQKYFECKPLIIGDADVELGIDVLLDNPKEVGSDRLVNAVAAYDSHGGPLIILDFGTATTFDVIDDKGNYFGGVIAPGINLSLEALHQAAAQLPRVAVSKPETVIGKSTVPAMKSGIYWGYVSMIEGMVARIEEEFGAKMNVVATGGLAPLFLNESEQITQADPDLTLRGLYLIHQRNA
jgi:type III pantothenate kinase